MLSAEKDTSLIAYSKHLVARLYELVHEPTIMAEKEGFQSLVELVHQNYARQVAINSVCLQLHASNYMVNLHQRCINVQLHDSINQGFNLVNKLEAKISTLEKDNVNHIDSISRLNKIVDITQSNLQEGKRQLHVHLEKIKVLSDEIKTLEKGRAKRDFTLDLLLVCISGSLVLSKYLNLLFQSMGSILFWKRRLIIQSTRLTKSLIFIGMLLKARRVCKERGFHAAFGKYWSFFQTLIELF